MFSIMTMASSTTNPVAMVSEALNRLSFRDEPDLDFAAISGTTRAPSHGSHEGESHSSPAATTVQTEAGVFEVPEAVEVRFSDADLIGWLGMSWKLIFKPEKHPWRDPSPVPEPIADDAKIALFGDWGTGLYGAPTIAKSVEKMDRCDVVFHLGDTYYSGSDDEIFRQSHRRLAAAR